MGSQYDNYPVETRCHETKNAYYILCKAHETCSSFLTIYDSTVTNSVHTDEIVHQENDLLRATLLFSTAGLDAMVKQLVKDALSKAVRSDIGAEVVFKGYIEKKLLRGEQINTSLLTKVLVANDSKTILLDEVIRDLTSNSLQSKDELLKVASFFNIPSNTLTTDFNLLKEIFDVRNQITHEMDIDFNESSFRRTRSRDRMVLYTNEVLKIANQLLLEVDNRLSGS